MKTYFTLFTFILCFSIIGCGSDEDSPGGSGNECNTEWFANQTNLILSTGITYGLDESEENCKKYVDAIEDWIDAAEDCDGISETEIEQTRMDLEEIDCN